MSQLSLHTEMQMIRRGEVAVLDIETTGKDAHYGHMACACFKVVRGPMITFRVDDKKNRNKLSDKMLNRQIIETLGKFSMIVTQYGKKFDVPFIRTRSFKNDEDMPPQFFHRDIWYYSKYKLRLPANSLAMQHEAMFGYTDKDHLHPWVRDGIIRRDKKAMDYTVEHCRKDVVETERLYLKYLEDLPRHIKRG